MHGSLDQLLAFAARQNASDVLLIAGTPVALRVNGALAPAAGPPLKPEDVRNLVLPLLDARQYEELQKKKSVDFCFVRDPGGPFPRQHPPPARHAGGQHPPAARAHSLARIAASARRARAASPSGARAWCW